MHYKLEIFNIIITYVNFCYLYLYFIVVDGPLNNILVQAGGKVPNDPYSLPPQTPMPEMLRSPNPRQPINSPGIRPGVDNSQNYQSVSIMTSGLESFYVAQTSFKYEIKNDKSYNTNFFFLDCWNDAPRSFTTNQESFTTTSHHSFISASTSLHKSNVTGNNLSCFFKYSYIVHLVFV